MNEKIRNIEILCNNGIYDEALLDCVRAIEELNGNMKELLLLYCETLFMTSETPEYLYEIRLDEICACIADICKKCFDIEEIFKIEKRLFDIFEKWRKKSGAEGLGHIYFAVKMRIAEEISSCTVVKEFRNQNNLTVYQYEKLRNFNK